MNNKIKTISIAGLFTAIIALVTFIIKVPIPGTNSGYVNFGDSVIFLFSYLLPNPYIALAAGIGSGLTDMFAGAAIYIIPTFIIKSLMALVSGKLVYQQKDMKKIFVALLISGAIMVVGYFLYELILNGVAAASVSLLYNLMQYIANVIAGTLLINATKKLGISVN